MAPLNMWIMEYCAHRPVSCKEGFHLDPLPKLIKLLRQIREVKLMEEDEALEMGREAATIRQSLGFIFARLFFPLVTVQCTLDRFTNELFWNFKECQVVLMEVYPTESMSEKKFFSNVAPSLGSGPPLVYKAKYKGLISKNQYPAITFDWSVLRT